MAHKNVDYPTHEIEPQSQMHPGPPGHQHGMDPEPESTKLTNQTTGELYEYKGSGKLAGKKAIVTGADSGIGRSVAIMYAREGADVTIVYHPDEENDAQVTRDAIEKAGRKVVSVPFDFENWKKTGETIVKKHLDEHGGQLDILVNNAGKQVRCEKLEEIDLDQVESTYRVNILSMFAITKAALPHMKRGASIIQSTSVVAYKGTDKFVDYSTTKAAAMTFTRSLSAQVAERGIRVNAVAPGPFYTPIQAISRPKDEMEKFGQDAVPLGRAGQPAEVGPPYVWLASDEASYMTGATIHVNGGMLVTN